MNKTQQKNAIKRGKVGQVYVKDLQGNTVFMDVDSIPITTRYGETTLKQHIERTEKLLQDTIAQYQNLIEVLQGTQFIHPDRQYVVVGLKDGYICVGTEYVVELTVDIAELYKGYCRIEDYKVVVDEKQKERYLNTFEGGIL